MMVIIKGCHNLIKRKHDVRLELYATEQKSLKNELHLHQMKQKNHAFTWMYS